MDGWIKLHRKIIDHPRFKDGDWLKVWVACLVLASHREYKALFGAKEITLSPGQFITSRKSLADRSNVQESKVERILTRLKTEHQIEQQSSSVSRLITVTNWREYQESEQGDEQQVNSGRTASEQQVNTNKNGKNVKKKDLPPTPPPGDGTWKPVPDPGRPLLAIPEFAVAWAGFLEVRKKLRVPNTPHALGLLFDRIDKLTHGDTAIAIAIVNQSAAQGWKGLFPLKEERHEANHRQGPAQRRETVWEHNARVDAERRARFEGAAGGGADRPDVQDVQPETSGASDAG